MRGSLLSVLTILAVVPLACAQPEPAVDYSAQVAQIADDAWEHMLEQSPYLQNRQGILVTEFPDLTEEENMANLEWSRAMLARVESIPMEALSHEDALTLECIRFDNQIALEGESYYWLQFPITPYSAGYLATFAQMMLAAYTFEEPQQTDMYLQLADEIADHLEQLTAHTKGQIDRGIYISRHALPGIVSMFQAMRAGIIRGAVTVSPERLEEVPEEDREAFATAVEEVISTRLEPAIDDLLALLGSDDYVNNAPDAVGVTQYPDGDAYYRYLVKANTTMSKTPQELHDFGKQRVAELEAEMAAIREEVGFEGTKDEFHQMLRTDERFLAKTPEEVEARYMGYIERIEPLVDDYFPSRPQAPYGVKRLDPAQEASMTFGFYQQPTPLEPVGNYRYNGSKLDERSLIWAGPLIFHELVPGHHFHIASQNENESIPMYQRENFAYGAFTEGWGNYSAKLAKEMGLLDDPYDRYGWALFEIFFSTRLVVDTAMNSMGWTLEEGRQYMRDHTFQSETEIGTESLRYSTDMPGQALNYHAGFQKLLDLRARAQELAGENFDIKDFHDAVLGNGSMPMEVLEKHIEWYFDPDRTATPKG